MHFLITIQTIAHVDIRNIIGYADDAVELASILSDLSKYACYNYASFEDFITCIDINIFNIGDEQLEFIKKIAEKYYDVIDEQYLDRKKWKCENFFGNYMDLKYVNLEGDVDMRKRDCKKIRQLLESCLQL